MNAIHRNATSVIPAIPPVLPHMPPPTAAGLYASIPPAVHWNLFRVLSVGVRHEQNLYGYFDAALSIIFPVSQRFQTNPQYPGRPPVEVGAAPHGHNVSIGSLGEIHSARGTVREQDMMFIDFFITKPLPRRLGTPRINAPILAIEIKSKMTAVEDIRREKTEVDNAVLQLSDYCERLSSGAYAQRDHTGFIPGYLVYGDYYTKLQLINGLWDAEPWQFIFEDLALHDGRAPFFYRLCEIAVGLWNFQG